MTQKTYLIYLRTSLYGRRDVFCADVRDDTTEERAMESVRLSFIDSLTREPLQLFVGTPAEVHDRVAALAALNDATAQTGAV